MKLNEPRRHELEMQCSDLPWLYSVLKVERSITLDFQQRDLSFLDPPC